MAQTPLVTHRLLNVEARFPKLNQPYFYDSSEGANGRTVPCSLDTPNAKWELGLRMDAKTTQDFMQAYAQAWQESPYANDPMPDPTQCNGQEKTPKLKNEGDDFWAVKSIHKNCKARTGKVQSPPFQVGRDARPVADDFELTTGSVVNIEMVFYPYKISGNVGMSFWLNGLQVVELAERQPIGAFTALDEPEEQEETNSFAPLDKETKPKVKTRKNKSTQEASEEPKTDLNDILSKFAPPSEVDDNE